MKPIFGAIALVAALSGSSAASAAVLYSQAYDGGSNIYASQNDTNTNGNFATTYDDFTLAGSADITSVDFTGGYFNPSSQGAITGFTLSLYSDNAGQPGSVVYTEHVSSNANETFLGNIGGFPIYTYDLATSFNAAGGSTYWLSVVADLGFPPEWGWTTGLTGDNHGYQCFFGSCGSLGNNFAFTLNGSTSVPEPLTLSLFGAGLAGAAALRRRRKPAA